MSLITTNFVQSRLQEILKETKKPEIISNIKNKDLEIKEKETYLISKNISCPINQIEVSEKIMTQINTDNFEQLLSREFYNPNIMEASFCILGSIFYGHVNSESPTFCNIQIRNWLKNMQERIEMKDIKKDCGCKKKTADDILKEDGIIPDSSSNDSKGNDDKNNGSSGNDTKSNDSKDEKDEIKVTDDNKEKNKYLEKFLKINQEAKLLDKLFMIKVPVRTDNNLIHEYFVGVYGTNKLRKYIPNFGYILGGFKCNNEYEKGCSCLDPITSKYNIKINYILYENLNDSISFKDYVSKCQPIDFLNKYLQVLYALHQANVLINFTHYDLHHENVILRKIESQSFLIPYMTENGKEYLNSDLISTIVDYSYSHINFNGENFGINNKLPYGVYPDRKHPLHDAYKLLLFSMHQMLLSSNMKCFKVASHILKFFNRTENVVDLIKRQREFFYYLPYTEKISKLNILHLTSYIRKLFHRETSMFMSKYPIKNKVILECNGQNICTDVKKLVRKIDSNSIFRFYDTIQTLKEKEKNTLISDLIKTFDYNSNIQEYIKRYNKSSNYIRDQIKTFMVYSLEHSSSEAIFDVNFMKLYENHIIKLLQISDFSKEFKNIIQAGIYVSEIYKDHDMSDKLKEGYKTLKNSYEPYLENAKKLLELDIKWLKALYNSNYVQNVLKINPDFNWYYRDLYDFYYIL